VFISGPQQTRYFAYQTAKECLTKQLLCIKGIRPEKVGAVVELYGILRGLWKELKEEPELNAANKRGKGVQKKSRCRERRVWPRGLVRIGKELPAKSYQLTFANHVNDLQEVSSQMSLALYHYP